MSDEYQIELASQQLGTKDGSRKYQVHGTEDAEIAQALVLAASPAKWANLVRQDVKVDEIGGGSWSVEVPYGTTAADNEDDDEPEITWSFEIGTTTLHICQALEHIADYPDATAPNHKGAISVDAEKNVQGTDIWVPTFTWEETHLFWPAEIANAAWIDKAESIVGHINQAPFRVWDRGELFLLGITGSSGTKREARVPVTFRFASSRTSVRSAEGIPGVLKEGWHCLWWEYERKEENGHYISKPWAAHVERVYDYADYGALGLGDPWNA